MARTKQTARKSTGFSIFNNDINNNNNVNTLDQLWPSKESPAPMTPQQQAQIEQEDRFRDLFANNRHSSEIADPRVLLTDVFANHSSLVYQEEDPDEKAVPKILTKARVLGRSGPCFNSKDKFLSNWKSFTNGVLDGLNWDNVFAAGGSVLANITSQDEGFEASDIDLFLYGFDSDEQANKKLEHIYSVVSKHNKEAKIIRSFRAVTILGSYPDYRHVQIILKLYKSPTEVLLGFDVDSCTVGFDGKTVWAADRCTRAVSKGYNLVNMSRRSLTYETRLRKYSKRGYAVAIPNLDKAQVDVNLFTKSAADVQGLAKLLIYEYYELNPPFYAPGKSYSTHKIIPRRFQYLQTQNSDNIDIVRDITGNEDSDYAEFIPWGPSWYSNTILNMLEYKDRASTFGRTYDKNTKPRPKTEKIEHVHSYVTGIKGVIEGSSSSFWCRYCRQNKPLEHGEDGKDVCGPLHWVNENQAYQDLDKGFRRSFAGSFQPVLQENWIEGVYAAGFQPREAPHPLKPVPKSPIKPSLFGSPVRASVPTGDMFVGAGGQHFESQNQMLRHQREGFGAQKDGGSVFGESVEAFGGRPSVDIFSNSVQAFGGGTLPFYATAVSDTPSKSSILKNLNSPQKPASSVPTYSAPPKSWASNTSSASFGASANTGSFGASKSANTIAPAWWSLFGQGQGSSASQMSYSSQALLLVAALYRKGAITLQLKSELKDLVLDNDPLVRSVVEAFFIDTDIAELVDSFNRLVSIKRR